MKILSKYVILVFVFFVFVTPLQAQEVIVVGGTDEAIAMLEADNWWGEKKRGQQLKVPHTMIVAISERWQKNAPKLTVPTKKKIFFSAMLPLVVHANTMVLDRREQLKRADAKLENGGMLSSDELSKLQETAVLLRIVKRKKAAQMTDPNQHRKVIKQILYRLDVIPAGLVLGQAAYESGYGTSRFAVKGNSLFGQWTYGGKGLKPEKQRKQLGDHRIARFEWPFDSVRGYFINLCSHPAYKDFRRIRAELKAAGKPLSSLALAEGLKSYSERGQKYVDTLKGIIRVNNLDIADGAVFRDMPMKFMLGAAGPEAAAKLRKQIESMRKSGEIDKIVKRMRLE